MLKVGKHFEEMAVGGKELERSHSEKVPGVIEAIFFNLRGENIWQFDRDYRDAKAGNFGAAMPNIIERYKPHYGGIDYQMVGYSSLHRDALVELLEERYNANVFGWNYYIFKTPANDAALKVNHA